MPHSFATLPSPTTPATPPSGAQLVHTGFAPGVARGPDSHVWFFVRDGQVAEVCYPQVDRCVASVSLDVEGRLDAAPAELRMPIAGVPAYVLSTERLARRVIADARRDALLIEATGAGGPLSLRLAAAGHAPRRVARGDRMVWVYEGPDVAMALASTAAIELVDGYFRLQPVDRTCVVALGFGTDAQVAVDTALAALAGSFEQAWEHYASGWQHYLGMLTLDRLEEHAHDHGHLLRTSAMVLAALEDKRHPGAIISSQSPPVVRPRDLSHAATARLALGDQAGAARALAFLVSTQRADGTWPNDMHCDGSAVGDGQPSQVAFPILLAWQLRTVVDLVASSAWVMARSAALYLARHQPVLAAEHDHSVATLAANVAALACASELAVLAEDEGLATYFAEQARVWEAKVERRTLDACEACGAAGDHYGHADAAPGCDVDATLLGLVRYGVREALDARLERSVAAIDRELRVLTPHAPVWRRRKADDAEHHGQPQPLLVGERGHYELAAGHARDAAHLLHALERLVDGSGTLANRLTNAARPEPALDAASPSAWAHAEYVKLARSLADGKVYDLVTATPRVLCEEGVHALEVWTFQEPVAAVRAGDRLRIEVQAPAELRWSWDGWQTWGHAPMSAIAPGVWAWDAPGVLDAGEQLVFTFYWSQGGNWEGRDFQVRVAGEARAVVPASGHPDARRGTPR